jgi:tRNA dimethylallyltransferase
LPSIRAVGYRQLWNHLEGKCALEEAARQAEVATRQLARRQLTWLRAEPEAEWYDPLVSGSSAQIMARVESWLNAQAGQEGPLC